MTYAFSEMLRREISARLGYDGTFNFAIGATAVATLVQWFWFISSFIAHRHRVDAATMVIIDWDPSMAMMHIRIGLALIISVGGLWSRRTIGLFLSALGLAWAIGEYIGWYTWSSKVRVNTDVEHFPGAIADALSLYGATLWNAVVLVLIISVLLWEAKWIVRNIKWRHEKR